ncbi:cytochrome P450 [Rhodococcus ruber]|uniref:Steroid C26-monooxygenase n=1 Tax=Rhodococcus ruber TaxID=1830 RepID=A0A098BT96_9NOCA|nr:MULTISPECIES: cytochrome P450 [Rhodococcus]AXY50729.1 cytochrome P450 [Rhodococcus ruber]MBP2210168.1 cholest-4-en-3-one 26-monooxygenase [Rhodococcus ruber]MCD2125583.1 cytochrome P450 [Rhodococcus ruber]MCZ1070440.1 cytochrome P450 [Rhodococcus sp. A5(2022)]MCZ4501852.1 cytochrome P450 [Rhodococcus ruber]
MTASRIDLKNPDLYTEGVPHDVFAELRRNCPVYRQDEEDGPGYWAVTRHADVTAVSRDSTTFSSALGTTQIDEFDEETRRKQAAMLVNLDPPEHTRLRQLVSRGFTPRAVRTLEGHIRGICNRVVDDLVERGRDGAVVDFVPVAAAPLPLEVIAALLGAPGEDVDRLCDWSDRMIGFDDPEYGNTRADGELAAAEIFLYANEIAAARRAEPRDDIVSRLVRPDENGDTLTEMEFDMFFVLLVVAGNETTRNAAAGGMQAFVDHPEQWRRLQAEPELAAGAVEEILRWVTPVIGFRRTPTCPATIGGQPVEAGDKVVVYYPSANRDEDVFEDPHVFDIGRTHNPHVAFGGTGVHFCLGAHLARLELRILFETLARRIERVEPAGPVRRLRSNFVNGIKSMPVRVYPKG